MKIVVLILILLSYFDGLSQHPDSARFVELSGSYGFGSSVIIYSGQIAIEYKPARSKAVSYNIEYSFSKDNGGYKYINNGVVTQSSSFIVRNRSWFVNALWHPIRTGKQPYSWIFLGLGAGYSEQMFPDFLANHGPAVQFTLGLQYVIKNKVMIGAKSQYFYMYNLYMDDQARFKFTGMPFRISVGYRF